MTRILAIDYGVKRIGLAITDPSKKIALPLCTVPAGKSCEKSVENIKTAIQNYTLSSIVVGLPLQPNGQEGPMSKQVRLFASFLEKLAIPIVFFDERFTSIKAEQSLQHFSRKKRSKMLDHTAALVLLQDYLEKIGHS